LKNLILIFSFVLLFSTGCAHNSAKPAPSPAPASNNQANDQQSPQKDNADEDYDDMEFSEDKNETSVADPLYPWNLAMFHFNDKLYFWLLKPVATGYEFIFPRL
jgi:phospholipid-binding lipoprotein MlaA